MTRSKNIHVMVVFGTRPEVVEAGTVKIVGTDKERIVSETLHLLSHPRDYQRMARAHNPYGDGKASKRIVRYLLERMPSTKIV